MQVNIVNDIIDTMIDTRLYRANVQGIFTYVDVVLPVTLRVICSVLDTSFSHDLPGFISEF